jgi:hypothetical protein
MSPLLLPGRLFALESTWLSYRQVLRALVYSRAEEPHFQRILRVRQGNTSLMNVAQCNVDAKTQGMISPSNVHTRQLCSSNSEILKRAQ